MDNNNDQFRGSTESATKSNRKIDINKVLQEAYETTKQKRTAIAGAIVWSAFILIAAMIFVVVLTQAIGISTESQSFDLVTLAVQILIWSPLMAGIQLMALRNVIGSTANINQAFVFLSKPWAIIGTALTAVVISQAPVLIGFEHFLSFLWAFFFQICFALAIIIVAAGQASPLNAVMLSFNLVVKRFLSFLILNIVLFVVVFLTAIPVALFGVLSANSSIALFATLLLGAAALYLLVAWFAPTYFHAIAIYYRDLFEIKAVVESNDDDTDGDDSSGNSNNTDETQSFNA